jgi:hypothetical protein
MWPKTAAPAEGFSPDLALAAFSLRNCARASHSNLTANDNIRADAVGAGLSTIVDKIPGPPAARRCGKGRRRVNPSTEEGFPIFASFALRSARDVAPSRPFRLFRRRWSTRWRSRGGSSAVELKTLGWASLLILAASGPNALQRVWLRCFAAIAGRI